MIIRKDIDLKQALTSEQKKMLEELKSRDVHPDENAPELTQEQLQQLARASQLRREERRKQSVTLRLSPQALNTAKSLGKGYTSILSRILESALKDADTLQHFSLTQNTSEMPRSASTGAFRCLS